MGFTGHLDECVESSGSLLCVGLDPVDVSSAAEAERACLEVLDATLPTACAVKPNVAFFEQLGSAGYAVLERLRGRVPRDRFYLVDAKRGDISSTAEAYARALFDVLGADAVTLNPLLGRDSVAPFLVRPGRGCFLVARSSNPGAGDILDAATAEGPTVFERIVELGLSWDPGGSVGFVVGATDPAAVAAIRSRAPGHPLLLPGVGAQGGSLEAAVQAGLDARGRGVLVSVSRGIAAAPEGPRAAAAAFHQRIQTARAAAAAT